MVEFMPILASDPRVRFHVAGQIRCRTGNRHERESWRTDAGAGTLSSLPTRSIATGPYTGRHELPQIGPNHLLGLAGDWCAMEIVPEPVQPLDSIDELPLDQVRQLSQEPPTRS